jgi:hypothetical protein
VGGDEGLSAVHVVALALPALTPLSVEDAAALALSALGVASGPSAGMGAIAGGLWLSYGAGLVRLETILSPTALSANATSSLFAADARAPPPVLADTPFALFRERFAPGGASEPASSLTLAMETTPGGFINLSVSIPWRGGLRFRLPAAIVSIESFAAAHRALLSGGPSSVFCPPGTAWPLPVPLGHVSVTTPSARSAAVAAAASAYSALAALSIDATGAANNSALSSWLDRVNATVDELVAVNVSADDDPYGVLTGYGGEYAAYSDASKRLRVPSPAPTAAPEAPLNVTAATAAAQAIAGGGGGLALPPTLIALVAEALNAVDRKNYTRDATEPAPAGYFSLSGTAFPCAAGTFSGRVGSFVRHCAVCPAGSACPEGARAPTPCGEGYFAPAGSPACEKCPGNAADVVATVSADEAAKEWPVYVPASGEPGARGLPSAEGGRACRTSRACCF